MRRRVRARCVRPRVAGRVAPRPPAGSSSGPGAPSPRPSAATNSAQHLVAAVARRPVQQSCAPGWCPAPAPECRGRASPARSGSGGRRRRPAPPPAAASAGTGTRRVPRARASAVGVHQWLGGQVERAGRAPVEHRGRARRRRRRRARSRPRDAGQRQRQQPGHRPGQQRGRPRRPAGRGSSGRSRWPASGCSTSVGRTTVSVVVRVPADDLAHHALGLGLVAGCTATLGMPVVGQSSVTTRSAGPAA